ncbi:MAG: anthranilate phosphoribosyltransferase [Candidatus Marinimicrobia bacterium]|nr:anthranilate phosphoribosyltransferase [FCB group bacterium]MBL7026328.1 anthranilate phosphoribosyltransferase [Candidatus Neomarinimicrobiota bacterium]
MLKLDHISTPALLLEKDGLISLRRGTLHQLKNLNQLAELQSSHSGSIAFVVPFCAAGENHMKVLGAEDILGLAVEEELTIPISEIDALTKTGDISFKHDFQPTLSDHDFAEGVKSIQQEEIAQGNACQVVFSRKFEGLLEAMSPLVPLTLFRRLLQQQGQYITFLFSDGAGHYFVGASPERQLEIHDENVIKNPIAGTMPKGNSEKFVAQLNSFLEDQKEINELSQILDEELKIMSQICPRGGKILGPFLRESGAVVHTEYHLVGHSKKPAIQALKISLHAPTLVGSPLESAFRIIAKREAASRRYYGGEIGIIDKNGDMYSAIMIRTAEIFKDGRIAIQAGAGIVRDSDPMKEARETQAKAAGLLSALRGDTTNTGTFLNSELLATVNQSLLERNSAFSTFHFEDQIGHRDLSNLHQESITIINNEDNFAHVLSHITRYLGYETHVVDTFDYDVINDTSDLVVLGPGPGDINDKKNPRMQRLLQITNMLAARNTPTLGVCLGLQAMAKCIGMPVQRQAIPTQGMQVEIDLFGKTERVGMYNSFSPMAENVPPGFEVSVNEDNRIMALKSENIWGFQFHVESAMTENGLEILTEALNSLMGIRERRRLSFESFVEKSISGKLNIEAQKEFLLDLNQHGFSGEDIADLVQVFYRQMHTDLELPGAIDLCGTGGSGLARINTSTMAAIIVAASGIPVAKHGNKAASGRFGSFDLLEAMGMNIMADKPRLESLFGELNLAFIFARSFHPVFKHFAQVRGELQTKTIFNLLGPLLNPAKPQYQIIGTSNQDDMELLIEAARALGKTKVMVLTGSDGLDELTLTGETTIMTLENGEISQSVLTPEDFGLKRVAFSEISGGDAAFNLKITREILDGTCQTPHRDLVLANAALALKFMGEVASYKEGVSRARHLIDQGFAGDLVHRYSRLSNAPDILLEIAVHKQSELASLKAMIPLDTLKKGLQASDRDFKAALSKSTDLNLIAEIKKASPSEKQIYQGTFSASEIASIYEQSGADAISVLTDKKYFKGSLENLKQARSATHRVPLLMKDFFIDEYQIYLARHYGADAILLIVALLTKEQIDRFIQVARSLDMDALVEVHNQEELEIALKTRAEIIGVNNRDLHTFEVDTKTFIRLYPGIPDTKITMAESGYSPVSANQLQGFAKAVLIGSSIMRSKDMGRAIQEIKTPKKKFKACGIRSIKDARYCDENNIAFIGLNFVPSSKRQIDVEIARRITASLKLSYSVGIFQNQTAAEVNQIAREAGLDFVQLSGSESVEYCQQMSLPVIKTLKMTDVDLIDSYSQDVAMFIIDGAIPGSGLGYDYSKINDLKPSKPFLVAGGIDPENARMILSILPEAAGLDAASGIETGDKVDINRIDSIAQAIKGE